MNRLRAQLMGLRQKRMTWYVAGFIDALLIVGLVIWLTAMFPYTE